MDIHMKDADDELVGRVLSRREALALLGAAAVLLPACTSGSGKGSESAQAAASTTTTLAPSTTLSPSTTVAAAAATPAAAPSCVVKPELTEGPYFVDEKLNRSDIRTDPTNNSTKPGALLKLDFRVSRVGSNGGCTALSGATVDVWHCDAGGLYSDVSANQTVGQKFLRGYQTTDANGACSFTTIYPGSYQGRAVHIHFKIRMGNNEFTSQLFFDDSFTTQVYASSPYKSGSRTMNSQDDIFRQSNNQLTLDVKKDGGGYASTFDIGMRF